MSRCSTQRDSTAVDAMGHTLHRETATTDAVTRETRSQLHSRGGSTTTQRDSTAVVTPAGGPADGAGSGGGFSGAGGGGGGGGAGTTGGSGGNGGNSEFPEIPTAVGGPLSVGNPGGIQVRDHGVAVAGSPGSGHSGGGGGGGSAIVFSGDNTAAATGG